MLHYLMLHLVNVSLPNIKFFNVALFNAVLFIVMRHYANDMSRYFIIVALLDFVVFSC